MTDWMNDMANAVEEAEAAQARAQEEVPTEPALSPRDSVLEIPVNDGQWTAEDYGRILWNVAQDLHARDQAILLPASGYDSKLSSGLRPDGKVLDQQDGLKNYNFQALNMVLAQNLRGSRRDTF